MRMSKIIQSRFEYWEDSNIMFFGVKPREWESMTISDIEKALNEDAEKYWNVETPCEIMQLVLSEKICKGSKFLSEGSISLKFNNESECIDVYGGFNIKDKKSQEIEVQERLIMSMPTPHIHFCWIINETKWVPRIHCYYNRSLLRKDEDGIVSLGHRDKRVPDNGSQLWDYDTNTKEFTIYEERIDKRRKSRNLVKMIPPQSLRMLEAIMGKNITTKNLEEALIKMPVFDSKSVYSLSYQHLDVFFNSIRMSKRFASPLKGIPLSVHGSFLKTSTSGGSFYDVSNKLVIFTSVVGAVESFNTVVYKTMRQSFSFEDTKPFFDAFKTSTNSKSAGKQRLVLDNVLIKDNMLWVKENDGTEHNMYQVMMDPSVQNKRLSKISQSLFCNNNAPKRIMLTAKLSAQSIPVKGQYDNLTNRVMARVVFADLEGYSLADSIVISESFAEKLRTTQKIPVIINKNKEPEIYDYFNDKITNDDLDLVSDDLIVISPTINMLYARNFENLKIESYQRRSKNVLKLNIIGDLPFSNGDKLTSLHGAKGVSGLIIPDKDMPYLKDPIGDFEAGPFEVIISGLSLMRRESMGQLFEAWANASGIDFDEGGDYIKLAVEKYSEQMKDFSNKSVIVYKGKEAIKPCGLINMIRLYHHASKQSSTAFLKTNYSKLLKIGYMEQLNIIANGGEGILSELGVRGLRKHTNSYRMIYDMMTKGFLPDKLYPSPSFNKLLRSMGMDMLLNNNSLVNTDNTEPDEIFNKLYKNTVDNNEINIIDLYEGEKDAN